MSNISSTEKQQYYGLDVLKFVMALLVVARHTIQIFYPVDSRWRIIIHYWLSNLGVPTFFAIAGFLLFKKAASDNENAAVPRLDSAKFRTYIFRILKLYILWSLIYLPIDIYNKQPVGFYLQSWFMSSTIIQLWYLPALIVAVVINWFLYKVFRGKTWLMLIFTGMLLIIGWTVDNHVVYKHLAPPVLQSFVGWYAPKFLTMRNGIFYGSFYVAAGAWIAGRNKRMPLVPTILICIAFLMVMYKEVLICSNINIVLSAAPVVICLTELSLRLKGSGNKVFLFIREQSEWIYFTHYYFIYLYSWTLSFNPLPITEANIMLCVLIPMFTFTFIIYWLSHREYGRWLKRLI